VGPVDGVVVVDKPEGWTSHDVVARCRKLFAQKRVGHAGTLDPDATGVLLVGLGRATRLLRFLAGLPKAYVGELVLGVATSTLDASGTVVGRWDMAGVGAGEVAAAAATFLGPIQQIPPMVSAVQVGGRRLYELARAGLEVERAPRAVTVHRIATEPVAGQPGVFRLAVECSTGTYVRSLAADIGTALGGGAHLRKLRRTSVGSFTEAEARVLDDVGPAAVLSPAQAMRDYAAVRVGAEVAAEVSYGRPLDAALLDAALPGDTGATGAGPDGAQPWMVHGPGGDLLAVYERGADGRAVAAVVLAAAG